MLVALGLGVVVPAIVSIGSLRFMSPFFPSSTLPRVLAISAVLLVTVLVFNLLVERLWKAFSFPGRGPQDYLPIRWFLRWQASRRVEELVEELSKAPPGPAALEGVKELSHALEKRDLYTRAHSGRVSRLAFDLLKHLGQPHEACELGRLVGLVHDVGKLAIPDSILFKPSALNEFENEMMKTHPVVGADLIRPFSSTALIEAVRHHHERMDGKGYPDSVRSGSLSLISRVIPVCDTYDSLISDRPYRPGCSKPEAFEVLRSASGSQLDPLLVEALIEVETSKTGFRAAAIFLPIGPLLRRLQHSTRASAAPAASPWAAAAVAVTVGLGGLGGASRSAPTTPAAPTATSVSAVESPIAGAGSGQALKSPSRKETIDSQAKESGPGKAKPPGGEPSSSPSPSPPSEKPCKLPTGTEVPKLPTVGCIADFLPLGTP